MTRCGGIDQRAMISGSKVSSGNAAGKVDASRMVASGWSMGGGGALLVAAKTPKLKATVAYAPWNTSSSAFKSITVPTIIFGATGDTIAGTIRPPTHLSTN